MRATFSFLSLFSLVLLSAPTFAHVDIRIATYNVDNYLVMDRQVAQRWRPSYPKPESEKRIVRQNILQHAPDILALQEMGSPEFLEELRLDLEREGLHYHYAMHLDGPDPDRHLALLSKLPPVEVVQHTDLDFKYFDRRERVKRGMLEATFEMGDGEVFKVFVVHLKSRYTDEEADSESQLRRVREAEACRDRMIERTHELGMEHYVVAGDFNDHPVSSTLRRFYRRGDFDIGVRLPAFDSRGEVWTYFYEKHGVYSLVDGFVVSPELLPKIHEGRGHIVDRLDTLEGSDHRMVYLDLSVR